MAQCKLILMTRWPAAGRCKQRLAHTIGHTQAAVIQARLTNHTFIVAKSLAKQGLVDVQLAIAGLGPKAAKRWGDNNNLTNIELQGEGNLGVRMKKQVLLAQKHFQPNKRPFRSIIIIGTDLPELSVRDLTCAVAALNTNEMVLGPANDGGYWLIGLSKKLIRPVVATWPFCGIPWGSDQVLKMTLHKAERQGTSVALLRTQFDVDNLNDLNPWQA